MRNLKLALKLIFVYFLMFAVFGSVTSIIFADELESKGRPHKREAVAPAEPSSAIPTATLAMTGDAPYGTQKAIDGIMYVYADRGMALYVSSGRDGIAGNGRVVVVYSLSKEHGKNMLHPVASGSRSESDGKMTFAGSLPKSLPDLYVDSYSGTTVYERSTGLFYEYAEMKAVDNAPCAAVTDDDIATVASLIKPGGFEAAEARDQAARQQQIAETRSYAGYATPVLCVTVGMIVMLLVIYFLLRDVRDDAAHDIRRTPVTYDLSADGSVMTIHPTMPALPSWFMVADILALATVAVEAAVVSVPWLRHLVYESLASQTLMAIGFIVALIVMTIIQFCVFGILEECVGQAEGCEDDDKGLLPSLVEMGAVVVFNVMGFMFSAGAGSLVPLLLANLCVSVPMTVGAWRRSHGRTPAHWLQLLHNTFMWMCGGILVALWMCLMIFVSLLDMHRRSNEAEERAARNRRAAEGDRFFVSDGNGGTLEMSRIGDSDEFHCSDGNMYTRSGGSGGFYGDYERR